jgi:hypothetical protein
MELGEVYEKRAEGRRLIVTSFALLTIVNGATQTYKKLMLEIARSSARMNEVL